MTAQPKPIAYSIGPMFPAGSAVIFGGSGGLGGAIGQSFAAQGSHVVLSYRSGADRAETHAEAIRQAGGTASTGHADLLDQELIKALLRDAAAVGPIHSVVFASGPHIYLEPIAKSDVRRLRDYIEADVIGFTNLAQAALPHLRESRGSITALVTCDVRQWLAHDILSIVPKIAVWALVQGLAKEEGRKGVRANAVGVGVIDAGMTIRARETGQFTEDFFIGVSDSSALKRVGRREDIAEAVAFLASSRASFVTGQLLNVDGGLVG